MKIQELAKQIRNNLKNSDENTYPAFRANLKNELKKLANENIIEFNKWMAWQNHHNMPENDGLFWFVCTDENDLGITISILQKFLSDEKIEKSLLPFTI